tara:strand:- start:143 stop:913 length:771 start_codon:yes stop_codon:yes gene_type:complete
MFLEVKSESKIITKTGDTLLKLSREYGVSLKELMHKNNLNDANKLLEGKVILIPTTKSNKTYEVKRGDTLYKIANKYQVKVKDIILINNLKDASYLKLNQTIILPRGAIYEEKVNQKKFKIASSNVFYHQKYKGESLSKIAQLHNISLKELTRLNNIKSPNDFNSTASLKIREKTSKKLVKYGTLKINWAEWRYFNGNYITKVKNKQNRMFFLALNCERRVLNNTLKNTDWGNWYFPKSDFEFKLINDFCNRDFKL